MFKKSTAVMLLFSLTAATAHAGGLLTNTNQNISFNRNFAREGTIGIDGVYYNPAGVSFLTKGFHLSLNVQNVYQTRDITSSITVPSLQGTPFYQPFKLNGGDDNGEKRFRGKASVPVLPSFQAAMVYDKWTLQPDSRSPAVEERLSSTTDCQVSRGRYRSFRQSSTVRD